MAAVVWFEPLAGHAADLPARSGVASVAAAAHLVAAGVWAGGLVVLAVCLLPVMRREPDLRGPMVATAWRTFSPLAAVATVVLVATGLYESGRYMPDIGSVTSTLYGGAVFAKVVLLALALALAGVNTLLVHPNLAEPVGRLLRRPVGWAPVSLRRFGTVVAIEVSVLLVAAVVAAVLTSVPPARDVDAAATATTTLRSANVDGLFITFEEVAAGPGTGRLIVQARSTVKLEQGPVVGATVLLVGPTGALEVPLREVEPGRYEAVTPIVPGGWEASVSLRREGRADAVMQASWTITDPASDALHPLELVTTGLAVLLLAALAFAVGSRRRTRSQRPAPPSAVVVEPPVRQP
jgi:copper transport protein